MNEGLRVKNSSIANIKCRKAILTRHVLAVLARSLAILAGFAILATGLAGLAILAATTLNNLLNSLLNMVSPLPLPWFLCLWFSFLA